MNLTSALLAILGKNYNPNQPRVPAGNVTGGQWTSGAAGITGGPSLVFNQALAKLEAAQAASKSEHYKKKLGTKIKQLKEAAAQGAKTGDYASAFAAIKNPDKMPLVGLAIDAGTKMGKPNAAVPAPAPAPAPAPGGKAPLGDIAAVLPLGVPPYAWNGLKTAYEIGNAQGVTAWYLNSPPGSKERQAAATFLGAMGLPLPTPPGDPDNGSPLMAAAHADGLNVGGYGGSSSSSPPLPPPSSPTPLTPAPGGSQGAPGGAAIPAGVASSLDTLQNPIDVSSWTPDGGQQGSNKGGWYKDAQGNRFYVKEPKSKDHVQNEVLAANLARMTGAEAPEVRAGTLNGKPVVVSRALDGAKPFASAADMAPLANMNFATQAWLGNWDAVGLSYDNQLLTPNGQAAVVDWGGSMKYRAQGAPKAFTDVPNELNTLRDPKINPQAAAVYGGDTSADRAARRLSTEGLASLTPEQIREAVAKTSWAKAEQDAMANTLINRRAAILAARATNATEQTLGARAFWDEGMLAQNALAAGQVPSAAPSLASSATASALAAASSAPGIKPGEVVSHFNFVAAHGGESPFRAQLAKAPQLKESDFRTGTELGLTSAEKKAANSYQSSSLDYHEWLRVRQATRAPTETDYYGVLGKGGHADPGPQARAYYMEADRSGLGHLQTSLSKKGETAKANAVGALRQHLKDNPMMPRSMADKVNAMSDLISKSRLSKPGFIVRAAAIQDVDRFINSVGSEFVDRGFTGGSAAGGSFAGGGSVGPWGVGSGAQTIRINLPAGAQAVSLRRAGNSSAFASEREILIQRNSRFRIVSAKKDSQGRLVAELDWIGVEHSRL